MYECYNGESVFQGTADDLESAVTLAGEHGDILEIADRENSWVVSDGQAVKCQDGTLEDLL